MCLPRGVSVVGHAPLPLTRRKPWASADSECAHAEAMGGGGGSGGHGGFERRLRELLALGARALARFLPALRLFAAYNAEQFEMMNFLNKSAKPLARYLAEVPVTP